MFLPQEIIRRKRDGIELGEAEITAFLRGFRDGSIAEGQIAAFAMAVFFRGMTRAETTALTRAMKRSGEVLDWSDLALAGPLLDKHSTGGVGDKTSLLVAPIVAACGGYVPMIAGRALGHTGGTVDKLESIPGYRSAPAIDTFRHIVPDLGCAIIGQTANLAPATPGSMPSPTSPRRPNRFPLSPPRSFRRRRRPGSTGRRVTARPRP